MTFVPFDATDDEIQALSVIRDGIPGSMEAPLRAWVMACLEGEWSVIYSEPAANLRQAHALQAALQIDFGAPASGDMKLIHLIGAIYAQGERTIMRVVDFLLSQMPYENTAVQDIAQILDWSNSKYRVDTFGLNPRLRLRLAEGIESSAQSTIDQSGAAGALLAKAWRYAFGIEPQPAEAMDFAVKAVERAATPVVSPRNDVATLGTATRDIKTQSDWTHGMRANELAPANTTIHHMMQTLWYGQQYRHVNQNATPPTAEQAQTHVMLAATLVGWFASGAVVRRQHDE